MEEGPDNGNCGDSDDCKDEKKPSDSREIASLLEFEGAMGTSAGNRCGGQSRRKKLSASCDNVLVDFVKDNGPKYPPPLSELDS